MKGRQRFLAPLEIYDDAIEELYVLGDRALLNLILRLERRRRDAAAQLAKLGAGAVSKHDQLDTAVFGSQRTL
jgi:hypothetical protein